MTADEVLSALKDMSAGKALGPDGLIKLYYTTFADQLNTS